MKFGFPQIDLLNQSVNLINSINAMNSINKKEASQLPSLSPFFNLTPATDIWRANTVLIPAQTIWGLQLINQTVYECSDKRA